MSEKNANLVDNIARLPLFRGLPGNQLKELARIAVDKPCRKGDILFSDGDEAAGFYTVISGRVKIYKVSPDGKEQILHIFEQGEFFGEVPMFAGGKYPAQAEVLDSGHVLLFPRNEFVRLLTGDTTLALNMLAVLSERLRRFTRLIDDLSLKDVPGRLSAYLLYLDEKSGSEGLELDITKGQLASLLGTIPETLSRILGRMSHRNLIRMEGRSIVILDRESLERIASGDKMLL